MSFIVPMKTGSILARSIPMSLMVALAGFYSLSISAQNPVADFISPLDGCLSQNVVYRNTSANATTYVWDFSFNDLNSPSNTQLSTAVPGHNIPTGISVIFESG